MPRTWPLDWDARRAGQGCPKCAEGRPAEDQPGMRFFAGYWADVRTTAKGIAWAYRPCQLNYATFGNAVPHVHTHIVPRYLDDPAPGRPLPDSAFSNATALSFPRARGSGRAATQHIKAVSSRWPESGRSA